MPKIRTTFDPSLQIDKPIEKVITFANRTPEVLEREARDYIVTENLATDYRKLLDYFDDSQTGDRSTECCVWLSGFYGSGKSSFAKYFGLSFDPTAKAGAAPFPEKFLTQFSDQTLRTRFNAVRSRYQVAVFLLDLSAQGRAGVTHVPISTQVFDRVCAWAGLVHEQKIADLEAFLLRDGRLEEFRAEAARRAGCDYSDLMAYPGNLMPIASELAHEYYPNIWKDPVIFQTVHTISIETEEERVERMLRIIENQCGTRRVLFILDEVGHFLQSNEALIANLDGFAKNLKHCGQGKAWLIATAQQTLPKAGALFALQARFPIKVDLRASDIRDITYRRLLRKSASGREQLLKKFADHGQQLVVLTRLDEYKTTTELDANSFTDFYPILPARFDVLIDSIRSLARAQGGIGLRSAIRCLQDLLTGRELKSGGAVLDREIPALVTVADLYDTLEMDLESVERDLVLHVETAKRNHGAGSWPHRVAKAVALLQQIDGFPASAANLAALLYPAVGAPAVTADVTAAIDALVKDEAIPFGPSGGGFAFLNEAVAVIETDRRNLIITSAKLEAARSRILRELFQSPPKATLHGAKTVQSGVDLFDGHRRQELAGGNAEVRFLIRLVDPGQLDTAKNTLCTESLGSDKKAFVYVAAPLAPTLTATLDDLVRSEETITAHRNNPNPSVQRYLETQESNAETRSEEVVALLTSSLYAGWLIFQGQPIAASTLGADLSQALNAQLEVVACQVYAKFGAAAVNVQADLAEKFLQITNLAQVATALNPLQVITGQGAATQILTQHPALAAIYDFLTIPREGVRVLNHFASAPYGWSKDTTRYLCAALFYAQQIKILTGGEEISVIGPTALNAFHNNTSFNRVTVKQNVTQPAPKVRQRAAERLRDLTGEQVVALPQRIAEVATKHLPHFLKEIQQLPSRVSGLGLPEERLQDLQSDIANALLGDGSDATAIFGEDPCELYENLQWARSVKQALDQGAADQLAQLAALRRDANHVPGLAEAIEAAAGETLARIADGTFHEHLPDLTHALQAVSGLVETHCRQAVEQCRSDLTRQIESIESSADFQSLSPGEQNTFRNQVSALPFDAPATLAGVRQAESSLLAATRQLQAIREAVHTAVHPKAPAGEPGEPIPAKPKRVTIRRTVATEEELDALIAQLQAQRTALPITLNPSAS